jgi:hypothetical protein
MPNLTPYLICFSILAIGLPAWGLWSHHAGWREGREALMAEQAEAAEKMRRENTQRQQFEDVKAVEAEQQGEAKTITITKELIRYVQTPGRVKCDFPPERVQLKARAVANANFASGFDAPPVPDAASGK